jgi:hypothetical protein
MRPIQKIISAGFAVAALASASVPALAWTVWPDVDFEWYANVGRPVNGATVEVFPAPRTGYIWSPGHWETLGTRQAWVEGQWITDDYQQQIAVYGDRTRYVEGAPVIRDVQGNPIPTDPNAYPVDSNRR